MINQVLEQEIIRLQRELRELQQIASFREALQSLDHNTLYAMTRAIWESGVEAAKAGEDVFDFADVTDFGPEYLAVQNLLSGLSNIKFFSDEFYAGVDKVRLLEWEDATDDEWVGDLRGVYEGSIVCRITLTPNGGAELIYYPDGEGGIPYPNLDEAKAAAQVNFDNDESPAPQPGMTALQP